MSQSSYLLNENFDSYTAGTFPSNWVLCYPGFGADLQVVTNSDFVSGPNSLKLEGATNNSANAEFRLSSTPDIIWLEVNVKVSHKDAIGIPSYPHANVGFNNNEVTTWGNGYGFVYFFASGSIVAGGKELQTYNENQWYKVKIKYNAGINKVDVWIDDVLKGSDLTLSGASLKYNALLLQGGNAGHSIGCFDNVKVWADTSTGINETSASNSIQIISDQAQDVITVKCKNDAAGQLISIYNIQGQLILQQPLLEATTDINVSALPKGLYVAKAGNKECQSVQKFVKK
ncbi:hypothetical protein BSYN_13400 [Bacteroides sedimenti]|uniref:Secretion system C-terminal sorting domain-containing protein n=2 Tax=Bacteroides sedimenti TaxID=2136147 RepID=A0ABM8IAN5_9BACE